MTVGKYNMNIVKPL